MRSGACLSSGLGSRSGSAFLTMPKTMSSFRNFKNRVHTLKWYLFSGNRYTCGMPFSNKWIASYVRKKAFSFKRKRRRQLSAESNAGKRNWHMMKGCTWILADKIWRDLIFIILMLYLIFSIFTFFIKFRRFIAAVCFSFSIINSNMLELQDFHDISISQHLLNSVANTGEPSVSFFPRLLLNF